MSGADQLNEEHPDMLSDAKTISFHSTPRIEPDPPRPSKPETKAEPKHVPAPLTMGLSRGVPTPHAVTAAFGLVSFVLFVMLVTTCSAVVCAFLAASLAAMWATIAHPVLSPAIHDLERRFGMTAIEENMGRLQFTTPDGRMHTGYLIVYGRRVSILDCHGDILAV